MNTIRKLGLAALATLAVVALAGLSSASASEALFKAESFPVTIKGSGSQEFGIEGATISCPTSTQNGEGSSASTWWTVKVEDSGCTIGGVPVTVAYGGCEIRYYTYSGLYIVCGGGVIKATNEKGCVVEIGPQELKTVTFGKFGEKTERGITAEVNVSGMKFTKNASCGGAGGTFNTGTIKGNVELKGFTKEGKRQGIFIE